MSMLSYNGEETFLFCVGFFGQRHLRERRASARRKMGDGLPWRRHHVRLQIPHKIVAFCLVFG